MNGQAFFLVEIAITPDTADEFRSVMRDTTRVVRADEPGTLIYECFVNADRTVGYILERYADDKAALTHSSTLPADLARRSQAFKPLRLNVFGDVSSAVREGRIEKLRAGVPDVTIVYCEPIA